MEVEKVLVQKLKNGSHEAFNELVELYSKKLYYLCLKMLQNEKDAEDTVQNVFLKAYLNINKFEEKSSLSTWMYRITVNVCTDLLRKRKKEIIVPLYNTDNDENEYNIEIEDEKANTEKTVIENERKQELFKAINCLNESHKKLIILRDLEGLSYDEIANILKLNLGTVKSGINRARAALLEILKENKELFS
jgi:RNA polymerase sigma-70 factor (ECF subfamily)